MNRELGITFRSEANTPQIIREVASNHGREIDMLGVYDDLGDMNPILPLYKAAEALPKDAKTRLGPVGFAIPKHRSMVDIVGHMTALHNLRPDKVFMGLVPGAWMDKIGNETATVSAMREAIQSATYLFEKRTDGYDGKAFKIQRGFSLNYEPPKRMPILIGAYGPRLAHLAGEVADEIKVGGSANPLLVPIIRERVAKGAQSIERDPNLIRIAFGAVSMVDTDRKRALDAARKKAVVYIGVVGKSDPTVIRDYPNEIQEITAAMKVGDVARAMRSLPDALTRRLTLAGTPQDLIKQSEELFAAGVSRIEFGTPHGITDELKGVGLLVQKVFPYFQRK